MRIDVKDQLLSINPFYTASGLIFQLCQDCPQASEKTPIAHYPAKNRPQLTEKIIRPREITVNFSFDSYRVSVADETKIIDFLKVVIDSDKITSIQVRGYTDSLGDSEYNQQLSLKRAESVSAVIKKYYPLLAPKVKTIGFGTCCPLSSNTTPQGRSANRRVTLVINIGD